MGAQFEVGWEYYCSWWIILQNYLPNNLNSAPQIEDKEHNRLVVHFLQTSKNDEEDEVSSHNLQKENIF